MQDWTLVIFSALIYFKQSLITKGKTYKIRLHCLWSDTECLLIAKNNTPNLNFIFRYAYCGIHPIYRYLDTSIFIHECETFIYCKYWIPYLWRYKTNSSFEKRRCISFFAVAIASPRALIVVVGQLAVEGDTIDMNCCRWIYNLFSPACRPKALHLTPVL